MPALLILLFSCLAPLAGAQVQGGEGQRMHADAVSMASHAASGRRTFVETKLDEAKVAYQRQPWQRVDVAGMNLEARSGKKGAPVVLFTAHFDVRRGSQGANNNASGCAVMIELLRWFKSHKPAENDLRAEIIFLFLDKSEHGMAGLKAWIDAHAGLEIRAAYNFDLCGRGDHVIAGPSARPLVNAAAYDVLRAAKSLKSKVNVLPSFASAEHKILAAAGIDAMTISVVPSKDLIAVSAIYGSAKRRSTAVLPEIYEQARRGQDGKEKLAAKALLATFVLGRRLLADALITPGLGQPLLPRYVAKKRDFLKALTVEKLVVLRDMADVLGPNGVMEVFLKATSRGDDARKAVEMLMPKLFAGKELQQSLAAVLKEGNAKTLKQAALIKRRVQWNAKGKFFQVSF